MKVASGGEPGDRLMIDPADTIVLIKDLTVAVLGDGVFRGYEPKDCLSFLKAPGLRANHIFDDDYVEAVRYDISLMSSMLCRAGRDARQPHSNVLAVLWC